MQPATYYEDLPTETVTLGVATSWSMPGFAREELPLLETTFEPNAALRSLVSFDESSLEFTFASELSGTSSLKGNSYTSTLSVVKQTGDVVVYSLLVQVTALPEFTEDLAAQDVIGGVATTWTLPEIDDGGIPLQLIIMQADRPISSFLTLDTESREVFFVGEEASQSLSGGTFSLLFRLINENGDESVFSQLVQVLTRPKFVAELED